MHNWSNSPTISLDITVWDVETCLNCLYHKTITLMPFLRPCTPCTPIITEPNKATNSNLTKALILMSEFNMLENGFLMLKEDSSYASPIATVFYEHYNT